MNLLLNGINGGYLRNIILNATEHTERVDATVAYVSESDLLFDWCCEDKSRFTSGDGSMSRSLSAFRFSTNSHLRRASRRPRIPQSGASGRPQSCHLAAKRLIASSSRLIRFVLKIGADRFPPGTMLRANP